jgi:serine/threonine-protein kinase
MPHHTKLFAGRYRVCGLLGQGGMGIVLDAVDVARDRRVAIKVLRDSLADQDVIRERFAREARVLRRLEGRQIVRLIDEGCTDGLPFLVLERLDGIDLCDLLDEEGRLSVGEAIAVVRQICSALADVHDAGIVHRDVKPENLFLAEDPMVASGMPTVKLLDFGIAKVEDESDASEPEVASMGTTAYMAPEQFEQPESVDRRADLWAIGVVLYELLTGRLPFDGATRTRIMMQVLTAEPPPPSRYDRRIPPELDRVILRCLAREREDRFADVDELDAALAPLTLAPRSPSAAERPRRTSLVRLAATGSGAANVAVSAA